MSGLRDNDWEIKQLHSRIRKARHSRGSASVDAMKAHKELLQKGSYNKGKMISERKLIGAKLRKKLDAASERREKLVRTPTPCVL